MEAISLTPYNVAILTNIAQSYLRQELFDDSIEFSSRAIFVNPKHFKALSRRAAAYHQQKKLKEAAQDMKKAIEIESQNEDLNEQFSIIVGDYEDFLTKSCLDQQMTKQSNKIIDESTQELHFLSELMTTIDQNTPNTFEELPEAWMTYELIVSFLRKTSTLRTFFRTSGHFLRLCDRIVQIVEIFLFKKKKIKKIQENILANMLQCIAAAMKNDARNQIVGFRHTSFRILILQLVTLRTTTTTTTTTTITSSTTTTTTPTITSSTISSTVDTKTEEQKFLEEKIGPLFFVRQSALSVLEEAIDSKSWKQMIVGSFSLIQTLFELFTKTSCNINQLHLTCSSILFTLSSTENGLKTLSTFLNPMETFEKMSMVLEQVIPNVITIQNTNTSSILTQKEMFFFFLQNSLGLLTNLSTQKFFRDTMEKKKDDCAVFFLKEKQQTWHQSLMKSLLTLSQLFDHKFQDFQERSLGILLNLTFSKEVFILEVLIDLQGVKQIISILFNLRVLSIPQNQDQKDQDQDKNQKDHKDEKVQFLSIQQWITIACRAVGLLCRFHTFGLDLKQTSLRQELTSLDLMDILYTNIWTPLFSLLLSSTSTSTSTSTMSTFMSTKKKEEIYQLTSQLFCHFDWCMNLKHQEICHFLRQHQFLSQLFQVLSNHSFSSFSSSIYHQDLEKQKEKMIGNLLKILVSFQKQNDKKNDFPIFSQYFHLQILVDILQHLPDGSARQNVAILLAKLCQQSNEIKENIREMRGIEMMWSISQTINKKQQKQQKQQNKAAASY
jgi:hypothetical protein